MKINEYLKLGEVFRYFIRVFKKPEPGDPRNLNIRMMHGINKISIIMFLVAVIVMVVRAIAR